MVNDIYKKTTEKAKEYAVPLKLLQKAYSSYLIRYVYPYFGIGAVLICLAAHGLAVLLEPLIGTITDFFYSAAFLAIALCLVFKIWRYLRALSPSRKVTDDRFSLKKDENGITVQYLTRKNAYLSINSYVLDYAFPPVVTQDDEEEAFENVLVLIDEPVVKQYADFFLLYQRNPNPRKKRPEMFYVLPREFFTRDEIVAFTEIKELQK
jgi:hypothetical protein